MTTMRSRSPAERLARRTASCDGIETLARTVFDVVAASVPFEFACLATTDPASGLITRAFKSHPLPLGDEDFAAAEYGAADVNQFSEIARRPVPVGVLSIDTGGRPDACRRFREYMAPVFGFTDELRLVCRSRNATWGALALYRGAGEPPFCVREADLLAQLHEIIADAVRRTLFADRPSPPSGGGAAVLIVDAGDRVTDRTAAVEARIDELGGWYRRSVPASVSVVAAKARSTGAPVQAQVPGRSGRWLTLRAMPLDGQASDRSVVITIDAADASSVGRLRLAARGLTEREQDVARCVLQGASTKDIAASLFLSPHTVQDHLKAVFGKLGVNSRREMIAQLVLPGDTGPG